MRRGFSGSRDSLGRPSATCGFCGWGASVGRFVVVLVATRPSGNPMDGRGLWWVGACVFGFGVRGGAVLVVLVTPWSYS